MLSWFREPYVHCLWLLVACWLRLSSGRRFLFIFGLPMAFVTKKDSGVKTVVKDGLGLLWVAHSSEKCEAVVPEQGAIAKQNLQVDLQLCFYPWQGACMHESQRHRLFKRKGASHS